MSSRAHVLGHREIQVEFSEAGRSNANANKIFQSTFCTCGSFMLFSSSRLSMQGPRIVLRPGKRVVTWYVSKYPAYVVDNYAVPLGASPVH